MAKIIQELEVILNKKFTGKNPKRQAEGAKVRVWQLFDLIIGNISVLTKTIKFLQNSIENMQILDT